MFLHAKIVRLTVDPMVDSNTLTIKLEQLLQDGEVGSSNSLDSALARPFRVLIEEGRNVGRLNHIFFTISGHSYIFGTLCNAPNYSVTAYLLSAVFRTKKHPVGAF